MTLCYELHNEFYIIENAKMFYNKVTYGDYIQKISQAKTIFGS